MTKFHVSKDGTPVPCTATVRACPLGEDVHGEFDSIEDANRFAEKVNERRAASDGHSTFGSMSKMVSSSALAPDHKAVNRLLKKIGEVYGHGVQKNFAGYVSDEEHPYTDRTALVSEYSSYGPYGVESDVDAVVTIDSYLTDDDDELNEGYRISRSYSVYDEESEDYIQIVSDSTFIHKDEAHKLQDEVEKSAKWLHEIEPDRDLQDFKAGRQIDSLKAAE